MSKSEVIKNLKAEIKQMNRVIDERIMRGLPYTSYARKHKLLRARLALIKQRSFLARSMRYVTAFML